MLRCFALLSAVAALPLAAQDHGQGPVEPGPIRVADLDLGTHWFGPEVDVADLAGKVVLVEIWGS